MPPGAFRSSSTIAATLRAAARSRTHPAHLFPASRFSLGMAAPDPDITRSVTSSAPRSERPRLSASVTAIGPGVIVSGDVSAAEHLIVEGKVEGTIILPDHGVAISGSGQVRGNVCARTVTVLGRVDGTVTASALIELRASAVVTGRLSAPLLSMEEGARFRGRVDPTRADAALAVARHRLPTATAPDPADK